MECVATIQVYFKNDDFYACEIEGYEQFLEIVHALSSWFSRWVFIGENVLIRTNTIASVRYVPPSHHKQEE